MTHQIIAEREFQRYAELAEPNLNTKNEYMDWWKANENNFPLLSRVVKCVGGMLICSGGLERVFCTAGEIVSSLRTRIADEMTSIQLLLKINFSSLKGCRISRNTSTVSQSFY
jgi:hypothetical protein